MLKTQVSRAPENCLWCVRLTRIAFLSNLVTIRKIWRKLVSSKLKVDYFLWRNYIDNLFRFYGNGFLVKRSCRNYKTFLPFLHARERFETYFRNWKTSIDGEFRKEDSREITFVKKVVWNLRIALEFATKVRKKIIKFAIARETIAARRSMNPPSSK